MSDISFFIDSDFNEYDSEVFSKDQIADAFVGAIRSISYEDDGVTICMGASEAIDGISMISAIVYSDRCTLEIYKDADDKTPVKSRDVELCDAIKAFEKFYKEKVPDFSKIGKAEETFMVESNFMEYPVPVRSKKQIEELVCMLPDVDECDCICDEDDYCDGPYVVLIAPDEVKGADYIQVLFDEEDGWYVEISFVDKKKRVNFAELFSDEGEAIRILTEFMNGNIPDVDGWTKVKI